jgi:cation:H+ antiporter
MGALLWLAVLATGLIVAVYASRWSVGHLTQFAAGTRIPPFVLGITLVSIGTDLPEIANSVVASLTGHGDINVGNSIGSVTVQATLVLGLLPLIAGSFPVAKGRLGRIGLATVAALLLGAVLMADGRLGRLDAAVLIVVWIAGTALVWRELPKDAAPFLDQRPKSTGHHLLKAMFGLVLVALGATTAIEAIVELAVLWDLPEYLIAFVLASIGTSLPELVVDVTAVRRKQWDLAVGDAVGSSFVDATLSPAIGPLIAPITVTAGVVIVGSLVAAASVGIAVLVLIQRKEHDWRSGIVLIGLFLVSYGLVAVFGS